MVGSHISEGISILSEPTYQPISLLVSVIFVAVCVCARVCVSLSWLLPILLPWSKLWQNFLSDPSCPGGMIAIGG
jgi:hypothetical protein